MRNKTMPRLLAAFLALLLCMGAFSVTAFAYGGETETDGSMAPYDPEPGAAEMKDTEAASDTEDTGDGSQTEGGADTDTLAEEQISDLLSALIGARGNITVTEDGVEITSEEGAKQTGTVTTNGGRLNVRTGADPTYERQFHTIENLMQHADMIINCGDAGQEGELIQRWVMQKAGARCPVKRLWLCHRWR